MGTYSESDVVTQVWRTLRDVGDLATNQLLTNTEITGFLRQAERIYGHDRPRLVVEDLAADGTTTLAITGAASWEDGFSRVVDIEEPIGNDPPAVRDPRAWRMYQSPAGMTVRWLDDTPAAGDSVRVRYTAPAAYAAAAASTTVPDPDHFAVCDLTASICADAIAGKYARTHEPVISADVTSYRTKSQEWQSIAKRLWQRYRDAMGQGSQAPAGPASGWVNWDTSASDGRSRLWHKGAQY